MVNTKADKFKLRRPGWERWLKMMYCHEAILLIGYGWGQQRPGAQTDNDCRQQLPIVDNLHISIHIL